MKKLILIILVLILFAVAFFSLESCESNGGGLSPLTQQIHPNQGALKYI